MTIEIDPLNGRFNKTLSFIIRNESCTDNIFLTDFDLIIPEKGENRIPFLQCYLPFYFYSSFVSKHFPIQSKSLKRIGSRNVVYDVRPS